MSNKKEIIKIIKEKIILNIPKAEIEKELSLKYTNEEFNKILTNFPEPELKQKYKKNNKTLIVLAYVLAFLGVFHGFLLGRAESENPVVRVAGALDGLILSVAVALMGLSTLKSFQKTSYLLVIFMSVFFLFKGLFYPVGLTTLAQIVLSIVVLVMSISLYKKMYPKNITKTETPTLVQ